MPEIRLLRQKIRFLRIARGLTQNQLAAQLGSSLRTYQRLENGTSPLDVQALMHLAHIFETSFYDLTNPFIEKSELSNVDIFKKPDELFEHSGLAGEEKNLIHKVVEKTLQGQLELEKVEKLPSFKLSNLPIYFSDLKKTTINHAFKKLTEDPEVNPIFASHDHWKASQYCLRNTCFGFHLTNNYTIVLGPKTQRIGEQPQLILGFHTDDNSIRTRNI